MSLALYDYINYYVKKQYIERFGSKSIGGKPINDIKLEKNLIAVSRYGNMQEVPLDDVIEESYGSGGEVMTVVVNLAKSELDNTKTLEDSELKTTFENARSVLAAINEEELSDEELFMKQIIDEGYELPASLIREFKRVTQKKYNRSRFFQVIQKEVGISCKGCGVYIIDTIEKLGRGNDSINEIALWTAGVYKRLCESGAKHPENCRDMAKSVSRKMICIRDENGYERLATLAEQTSYNNKCYCKTIAVLPKEKARMLSTVAWLMTGDETMYKCGNLEDTSMRFARQRGDKVITVDEVMYRINIGYKEMLEALQYISTDEFINSDALEIVNSLKKKDVDFLDKEPKVYTDADWHKDDDSKCIGVSMKDIIKTVSKINPVTEYEKFGRKIAATANKMKNYYLSEKQRDVVVGVYVRANTEKVEVSQEIKDTINYILKYRGNRLKSDSIVRSIINQVERTGKCSEKQYSVLANEVTSIKDEIARTTGTIESDVDSSKYNKVNSEQISRAGKFEENRRHSDASTDNAANLFGLGLMDMGDSMEKLARGELEGGATEDEQ